MSVCFNSAMSAASFVRLSFAFADSSAKALDSSSRPCSSCARTRSSFSSMIPAPGHAEFLRSISSLLLLFRLRGGLAEQPRHILHGRHRAVVVQSRLTQDSQPALHHF